MFFLSKALFFIRNKISNLFFEEINFSSAKAFLKSLFLNPKIEQIVNKAQGNILINISLRVINYVIISTIILSIYKHILELFNGKEDDKEQKNESFIKRKLRGVKKYLSFEMVDLDESGYFEFATLSGLTYLIKTIVSLAVVEAIRKKRTTIDISSFPVFLGSSFLGVLVIDILVRSYSSLKKIIGKKVTIIHSTNFEEEKSGLITKKEEGLNEAENDLKEAQQLRTYSVNNKVDLEKLKEFLFFMKENKIDLEDAKKLAFYGLKNKKDLTKIKQFSEILLEIVPEIYNSFIEKEELISSKLHKYIFELLERSTAQNINMCLPKKNEDRKTSSLIIIKDNVEIEMDRKIASYASEKGVKSGEIKEFTDYVLEQRINYVKMAKFVSYLSEKEIALNELKKFTDFKFASKKEKIDYALEKTSIKELEKSKFYHFLPMGITLASMITVRVLSEGRSKFVSFLRK